MCWCFDIFCSRLDILDKNVYKPLAYLIVFRVSNEYILSFIDNTISPSSKIDTKISSVCSCQQSSASFRHWATSLLSLSDMSLSILNVFMLIQAV